MKVRTIALLALAMLTAGGALWAAGQEGEAAAPEERMVITWFGINSRGVLLPENTVSEQYVEERYNVGWGSIIYLAAISSIDPQLYEAAALDGAGRIQRIRHITLPSIVHVIVILFLLRIGDIMEAGFDQIFNLYNPLVYSVGDIIDTYVFRTGITDFQYSYAAAVDLFKNITGLILLLIVNYVTKRLGSEATVV